MEDLLVFSVIFLFLQKGLTSEEICGETRHVSSNVGREVVLPIQQTEIRDITWMAARDKNIFAVTEPGKAVTTRSLLYNGRLNVTPNGSLIITKLTREDEGIYKGSVLRRTSGQCAQLYNLTVNEEQVYFFNSSSTTSPVRGSTGAKTTMASKRVTEWITIALCVSATAALLFIFAVTLVFTCQTGTCCREGEIIYANLYTIQLQKVSRGRNIQEQPTVTYSQVDFALKTKKTNV